MKTEPRWQIDQPSEAQQDASAERSFLLEVIIEQPGATSNLYRHDRERGALRLEGVLWVETPRPTDLARYPLERQQSALERIAPPEGKVSADASGATPAFPVLLVSSVAVAPGAWVSARLIGALRASSHHDELPTQGWMLLAVPAVDSSQQQITTYAQLEARRRTDLAAFVAQQGSWNEDTEGESAGETVEWLEAAEAARLVRQATFAWRQTARQRQAQTASAQGPREHLRIGRRQVEPAARGAWRAIEGVSLQQIREQGLGAYAEAEHLLRFVPQRFQQYLGELLLDDERVLCFIERPRLRTSRGLLGLGARYLNEGLLLCTDRQILWLRDVAAPDATLVPWGYVARSCPVERLAGVQLVPAGQAQGALGLAATSWLRLVIQSEASQGTTSLVVEFPDAALPALQQAAALLERFLPFPSGSLQAVADRRVRRLPEVSIWQPRPDEQEWLRQLGGIVPAETRQHLEEALKQALHPGEQVLAQAMAPALDDSADGPRLLTLTRERLLFGQTTEISRRRRGSAEPPTTFTVVPLEQVAAVQLRHSLLGSLFEVCIPTPDGRVMQPAIPFNSPAIVPFRAIYTRTRLLLAAPYRGNARCEQARDTGHAPRR